MSDGFRMELVSSVELHPYSSETWWTSAGARKKERRLKKAGIPNLTNWRFITLTIANRVDCPLDAYLRGKDRIRRFLAKFRNALGHEFLWCWKLECHHDDGGYPHWHLLVQYTSRIPQEMLSEIERWWGLGRINVRCVRGTDIRYVLKYVTKHAEEVPEWVGRHLGRIRVFQTSRGFYTNRKQRGRGEKKTGKRVLVVDLFTRLEGDKSKAMVIRRDVLGNTRHRVKKLPTTFQALLLLSAQESIRRREELAPPGVVNPSQLKGKIRLDEH